MSGFLDQVEQYLLNRGKPVEKRGSMDCVAFLAYCLQITVSDFDAFTAALTAEVDKIRPKLDVLADASGITYVGIPMTKLQLAAPTPVAERSAEAIALEEIQGAFYLVQYELAQSQARTQAAQQEAAEAQAQLRHASSQVATLTANLQAARAQLAQTAGLRATAQEVATLTAAKKEAERALNNRTQELATAVRVAQEANETLERFTRKKDSHTCSVSGLRELLTGPCGCIIIADHRGCNGERVAIVSVMPHRTVMQVAFVNNRAASAQVTIAAAAESSEVGGIVGSRKAKRMASRTSPVRARTFDPLPLQRHESTYTVEQ